MAAFVLHGLRWIDTADNAQPAKPNVFIKYVCMDSPGGTVDKNQPAKAGDMSWIPSLGRLHMPQSN